MTLDEILGYPQHFIDSHPKATRIHKCGIYKEDYKYIPPASTGRRYHSTSTVDHTGLTATQRSILAVLKKAKTKMDATQMAKAIKQSHGSASMNMAKLYKMSVIERDYVKNGKTRWYIYYVS